MVLETMFKILLLYLLITKSYPFPSGTSIVSGFLSKKLNFKSNS